MRTLILIALVGLGAQLVDGGLGMAYGVTTSTLLLMIGANPAAASATVHLAEVGTTLASGLSHWRFGNVDWPVVAKIGIPGAIGGFLGATALSSLDASIARPLMSSVLLILGVYILFRFTFKGLRKERLGRKVPTRFLAPLGLFAGFIDATGGGGWGPVGTPALLADGRLEPRKAVGSVNTAEFMVTVAASLGFLFHLGSQGISFGWVAAPPDRRRDRRPHRRSPGQGDPGSCTGPRRRWPDRADQRPDVTLPGRVGRPVVADQRGAFRHRRRRDHRDRLRREGAPGRARRHRHDAPSPDHGRRAGNGTSQRRAGGRRRRSPRELLRSWLTPSMRRRPTLSKQYA